MTVHVLPVWEKNPYNCLEVSTVLNYGVFRELSPFVLAAPPAMNLENLWQFSKVYKEHLVNDEIQPVWFQWRNNGWADTRAHRYPMGKGRKPEFSYWDGERLGYLEARKVIYTTEYAKNVILTTSYAQLVGLYSSWHGEITLKDYDAYDHLKLGMSLKDVINNPHRIMGHAFVLAMMLEGVLEECLK